MTWRQFWLTAAVTFLPACSCAGSEPAARPSPDRAGASTVGSAAPPSTAQTQRAALPNDILEQVQRPLWKVDTRTQADQPPPELRIRKTFAEVPLPSTGPGEVDMLFPWRASGLCHHPLYFEELGPERYGTSRCCLLQPLLSAGHFAGSAVTLPVQLLAEPPCQCPSALGGLRPGSTLPCCAPPRCGAVTGHCERSAGRSGSPAPPATGKRRAREPERCSP